MKTLKLNTKEADLIYDLLESNCENNLVLQSRATSKEQEEAINEDDYHTHRILEKLSK